MSATRDALHRKKEGFVLLLTRATFHDVFGPNSTLAGCMCYYCGGQTEFPVVEWHGYGEDVWLHPSCAVIFANHLIKDAVLGDSLIITKSMGGQERGRSAAGA